jgi:deoxyribodipyrimidine photo-lyase
MNIWWIRRDLRLDDNPALNAALRESGSVLPVFILDDHLLERPAGKRQAFLFCGLHALEQELKKLGSGLIVRRGDPSVELPRLAAEINADSVFAEMDVSPYARRRDAAVTRQANLQLVIGSSFHPPEAVRQSDGKPYRMFTPFSIAWKALPLSDQTLPAPTELNPIQDLPSEPIPEPSSTNLFKAGELEAQNRLEKFVGETINQYQAMRDRMDLNGTSQLSPYLRFGMLSIRRAVLSAMRAAGAVEDEPARAGCETWLKELIWREFYQSILYHFPSVLSGAFKPGMRALPWREAPDELSAWQAGITGYPVVDAAMRQLSATGWMHNRARMIAASFLVKHLLIDWQAGERWFIRQLIDGDSASNNGGWQWIAGTGTDAVPYFRIFNPILQGKKFDPFGAYVRRWVPELTGVPDRFVHCPWQMAISEQRASRVIIGRDYPVPIVEHNAARIRALSLYKNQGRKNS